MDFLGVICCAIYSRHLLDTLRQRNPKEVPNQVSIVGLSTIPTLIVASLAVFRLAYLITKESGPFFFFWYARKAAKKDKDSSLAEGIDCPYCVGVWVSVAITLYLLLPFRLLWIDYSIVILAVAGLAMLLHQVFTNLQK